MGNDLFVDAAESASFPLPDARKREGGEKMQPLHRFPSHLGTYQRRGWTAKAYIIINVVLIKK